MRINLVGSTAFKSMAVVISGEDEAKAIKDVTGAHMQGLGTVNYETGSQWVIATGETDKNLLTKLCGQVKDEFEKTGRKVYAVFETGDFEGKTTYFKLWQEKVKDLKLTQLDAEEAYHFFTDAILKTAHV